MQESNYSKYFVMASIALTLGATQLYIPAMPAMAEFFQTNSNNLQVSISVFIFAKALMSLFYGPLSDSIGRRNVYIYGLSLFFICSLALVFVNSIELFIFFRFFQGVGAASSTISAAVISDIFDDKNSGKAMAQMSVIIVLSPALMPVIGGNITTYLGWRYCFILITILVGILGYYFYKYFEETRPQEHASDFHPLVIIKNYTKVFKRPMFVTYALLQALPSAALWCVITTQPFVFINAMGVTESTYGFYTMSLIFLNSATSYMVQHIITRTGPIFLIRIGILSVFISAMGLATVTILAPKSPTLALFGIAPLMFSLPLIFPSAFSKALSHVRDISGTGSSAISFLRQIASFLGTLAAGFLPNDNLLPTAFFLAIIAILILLTKILSYRYESMSGLYH